MLFTCSFPKNATVESACCGNGPKPSNLSLFTLAPDNTSYCATNDDVDGLTGCLADHGVIYDECHIEGVDVAATTNSTNKDSSSAPPPRPTRSAWIIAAFIGLTLLTGVTADSPSTECSWFDTNDQQSWDFAARMEPQSLDGGAGYQDCRGSSQPCSLTETSRPKWTAQWSAPDGVKVTANMSRVIATAEETDRTKQYAESVSWPQLPNHQAWKFPNSAVITIKGVVAATRVTGTFSDCKDKKTYGGSALIPRADDFWLKVEQASS